MAIKVSSSHFLKSSLLSERLNEWLMLCHVESGLDAVEKKFGYSQSRETNEKITDGARGMFEKATGYVLYHIITSYSTRVQNMG